MYVKSLNIKRAHYGENNLNLAESCNDIADIYREQGKLDQALEMYMKCFNIMKAYYGENNFNLAGLYNNIGLLYKEQNK